MSISRKLHTILFINITNEEKNQNINECTGKLMAILTFRVHLWSKREITINLLFNLSMIKNLRKFPKSAWERPGHGREWGNAPSLHRWLQH